MPRFVPAPKKVAVVGLVKQETRRQVEALATRRGMSLSEITRVAVEEYVGRQEEQDSAVGGSSGR